MRVLISLVLILISVSISRAEDHAYSYLSGEFSDIPQDIPADMIKTDMNGDTLAVVLIRTEVGDLSFKGNVFGDPLKSDNTHGFEYTVYMTDGSRSLTIQSKDFHQVVLSFPKPVKSNELWQVKVVGHEAQEADVIGSYDVDYTYDVIIQTDPFVELYIDEELIPDTCYNGSVCERDLEEGSHYITSKYKDYEYSQKIKVEHNGQYVDAGLGSNVTVKNGSDVTLWTYLYPHANLKSSKGSTFVFDGVLGQYVLEGKTNSVSFGKVSESVQIDPRSNYVFRLDEMVWYGFLNYYGTVSQPVGFNLSFCKNVGFFLSYCTDVISSIDTKYGEFDFFENEGNKVKNTSMTFSAGPMFRLWHKLYLQTGAGCAYYLSTSEPEILTADYKYKAGLSINAGLFLRVRAFMMGVGYVRQFVKDAYNPDISNQLSFSVGLAFGV